MGGFRKNELAEKRGYSYRLTRRQFLVASSAAALAACGPAAVAPGATGSAAASPGKTLKIGQLLPFTGGYSEHGNSMRRATERHLKLNDNKLANRPVQLIYRDDANDPAAGIAQDQT